MTQDAGSTGSCAKGYCSCALLAEMKSSSSLEASPAAVTRRIVNRRRIIVILDTVEAVEVAAVLKIVLIPLRANHSVTLRRQ